MFTVERMEEIRNLMGTRYLDYSQKFTEEDTEFVKAAYAEISRINRELFQQLPCEVVFTSNDPYSSAKEMRAEISKTGIAYIYTEYDGHPFLDKENNSIGRAIHDIFSHCVCGCPFDFCGEVNAYLEQRKYYPEWTWGVLCGEIPFQTAAFYSNGKSFHGIKQRAFSAPKEFISMCEELEKDYSKNAIFPKFTNLYA